MLSIALIPARSGSKRLPDKNILSLADHPLIAYTVRAAIDSGVFNRIICATDSSLYAKIATHYGAEVPFLRPKEISGDQSPDIEWVDWILKHFLEQDLNYSIFSILRPTNPFRRAETIRRAWKIFLDNKEIDSLRAVEKCKQHPGKMWILQDSTMQPLFPFKNKDTPWHSCQYAALPEIYVQNASLEIAWSRVVFDKNSISGDLITPFLTENIEGFDINYPEDLELAEKYASNDFSKLPKINVPSFFGYQEDGS